MAAASAEKPRPAVKPVAKAQLAMDRAYKGDKTNQVVQNPKMMPLVSPKDNRKVE